MCRNLRCTVQSEKLSSLLKIATGHHRAGRLAEAETLYRQARAAAPRDFDVFHLSGLVAQQQGRVADAITWLTRALKVSPENGRCARSLGVMLMEAKRVPEAEQHLRRAVQLKPEDYEGWDRLAYCLKIQDRLAEALVCHEKVVKLKPDYAVGWYNWGLTLSVWGRIADALVCHERALVADPSYALARFGRAQALHQAGRIEEAVAEYGRFLALAPNHFEAHSYRLFALHNLAEISREELFAEHLAFGRAVPAPRPPPFANTGEPKRRLRVACLSPDFRTHSCAYFIEPLLKHLDRSQFEIYLYHDHFREDAVTARFKTYAAVWRNFVGQSGPLVERTIRADAPDILIDLAGHTGMTNRLPLFARRLAPVQITYLGYPNTTGLPAMDYRFTDDWADPAGEADGFATEQLVRFAPSAWTYAPPEEAPEEVVAPSRARGYVTFGCFNNLAKITDPVLALWGRIMAAVPNARLQLKGRGLSEAPVRAAYLERFARVGLASERVDFIERTAGTAEHLALYRDIDIALDTFPYHGTTTTCEALWMGVPVVSLVGDRHMARVGASLLTAVGRPQGLAATPDDYVRIAVDWAVTAERLDPVRNGLRDAMRASVLLDHAGQAERFGGALRTCWAAWCARSVPVPRASMAG